MTKQFDLNLNTTDLMMNNTQMYSSKEKMNFDSNEFGSFLDTANKSYMNNSKEDNKFDYSKKDFKQENNNYNKPTYGQKNEKETVKEDSSNMNVNSETKSTYQVVEVQEDVNDQVNTFETVDSFELTDETNFVDFELPTEMIMSGITFEEAPKLENLVIEDFSQDLSEEIELPTVDSKLIDEAIKDVSVSKDDTIKSMYTAKLEQTQPKEEKVETLDEKLSFDDLKAEVKDLAVNNENLKETVVDTDTSVSKKVVDEKEIKIDDKLSKTDKKDLQVVKDEVKVKVEDKNVQVKEDDLKIDEVEISRMEDQVVIDDNQEDLINNTVKPFEDKMSELNMKVVSEASKVVEVDQKTPVEEVKTQELQEELTSANYENMLNKTDVKTDKNSSALNNTKVELNKEDSILVDEDVSDIEIMNQPKVSVEDEKVDDNFAQKVSEKVENVKIQVEDNVKIQPQSTANFDENKSAKANETLVKSGLNTENLKKLDAKVEELDFSNQNEGTDLGQSSQEMIMRDMMQENVPGVQTSELKVDFAQSLNKTMTAQTTNTQPQQQPQDLDIIDQISAKFAANSKNGMQKVTIGLTPEALGKVTVEITKGQNGISAHILAENPQAKEILDKNLDGLKSALQSQGVNVNNVNVKVAEAGRSSDSNNNNMFQNENGQYDSSHGGKNSNDSNDQEKRTEYEFVQKQALNNDEEQIEEETDSPSVTEKTVNIKAGLGNVSYKM